MNKDLRVIFFGTSAFVTSVLEAINDNYNLVGVVTTPDKPTGRNGELTPSPVKSAFLKLQSQGKILIPEKISSQGADKEFVLAVKDLNPDLIVVASYGRLIPEEVLDIPKYGCLNIHPSLLPKYRGVSPMPTAILNGDPETGVTIIKMDREMDHGPIVAWSKQPITKDDTFDSLSKSLFQLGVGVLVEVLPDYLSGQIVPIEQDHTQATFTKFIKKEDGFFEINNPPASDKLDRMIRAHYPWPGVWTVWEEKRDKQSFSTSKQSLAPNGTKRKEKKIVKLLPGKKIQIEGKKPVSLEEFLRGYPDFPLKKL